MIYVKYGYFKFPENLIPFSSQFFEKMISSGYAGILLIEVGEGKNLSEGGGGRV
jgi:hypothetical protein